MSPTLVLLSIAIGLGGGVMALVFYHCIETVTLFSSTLYQTLGASGTVIVASLGGLCCGLLVYYLAREAKGHGVPEVMQAISVRGGVIRPRVVMVKDIASAITIGTGGSAGREGPIVQIGGALGSTLGQIFKVPRRYLQLMVACGAAAGIAATFNTPIAGSIFAMEVILREYSPAAFGLSVISAVAASAAMRGHFAGKPVFDVPAYQLGSAGELLLYALLGVLAMAVAQIYTRVLYRCEDTFDGWTGCPGFLKPAAGGILFGLMGVALPLTLGRGETVVEAVLSGHVPEVLIGSSTVLMAPWLWLCLLGFAKILTTSITIGSGGSGGVFFPGLYIGAVIGGSFGQVAHFILPSIAQNPGAYALVGMGATFAGMTQAPFTAILMVFEMTRNYWIILPLMTAGVAASLLSGTVSRDTIYTLKLRRKGVPIPGPSRLDIMREILVSEAMTREVVTVSGESRLREVVSLMQATGHNGFPVTDENGHLRGIITLYDLRRSDPRGRLERSVKDIATHTVHTVSPGDTLEHALQIMNTNSVGRLPVVSEDARLVGLITQNDIMRAYGRCASLRNARGLQVPY